MNDAGTKLRQALEAAVKEVVATKSPLTDKVVAERAGSKRYPAEILSNGKLSLTSPATIKAISGGVGSEVAEQAAKLQAEYDKAEAQLETVSTTSSARRQQMVTQDLIARVAAGEPLPKDTVIHSRETIAQSDRVLRQAGVARLETISNQARELAKPVFDAIDAKVIEYAKDREASDRAEAESLGVEYEPSMAWKAAISVLLTFRSDRLAPGPRSPRNLFTGIIEI